MTSIYGSTPMAVSFDPLHFLLHNDFGTRENRDTGTPPPRRRSGKAHFKFLLSLTNLKDFGLESNGDDVPIRIDVRFSPDDWEVPCERVHPLLPTARASVYTRFLCFLIISFLPVRTLYLGGTPGASSTEKRQYCTYR